MEGHTQWDAPNCWGLAPFIQIRRNMDENPDYMFQYEVVLYVDTGNDDITLPVGIHWQVAYAVLEKSEPIKWDIRHVTITFYDTHDNPIVSLSSDVDMRCKAGKYIIDPEFSAKKKQRVDGGCLFCDKAVYQKEGGIVYIACTKYDGRVKEVEYTGEAYPEYCKRRA